MSDTLTNLTRQVRCEDPLPHLVRRLQHRAPVVDSDSMDEDIQPPKAGSGPLYGTTAALRVSQVPLEGLQPRRTLGLRAQAIQGGTIAVHSNHPGAHAPQGQARPMPPAPATRQRLPSSPSHWPAVTSIEGEYGPDMHLRYLTRWGGRTAAARRGHRRHYRA